MKQTSNMTTSPINKLLRARGFTKITGRYIKVRQGYSDYRTEYAYRGKGYIICRHAPMATVEANGFATVDEKQAYMAAIAEALTTGGIKHKTVMAGRNISYIEVDMRQF